MCFRSARWATCSFIIGALPYRGPSEDACARLGRSHAETLHGPSWPRLLGGTLGSASAALLQDPTPTAARRLETKDS